MLPARRESLELPNYFGEECQLKTGRCLQWGPSTSSTGEEMF